MIGERISHFEIEEKLGSGGMGEVFRARDVQLKRLVAIKRLHPDLAGNSDYRRRFLREAQHAANVTHQSIASIYDILEIQGDLYLVMEYVDGVPLLQWDFAVSGLEQFLSIAEQCAQALSAAHSQGVIHRDIKPGNILLTRSQQVKVLDFGLAQKTSTFDPLASSDETPREQGTRGTPAYMAPEIIRGGGADVRSDIFSLGVVFYELLTGHHPFLAGNLATTINRIMSSNPSPVIQINPRIPQDLSQAISKMLEKDRALRYASAADVLSDLRRIRRDIFGTPLEPLPALDRPSSTFKRHRAIWASSAFIVLVVVSSGILNRWNETPSLPANPTVAILPITVGDHGQTDLPAFSSGMTEVLSNNLGRLSQRYPFNVIPASSVRDTPLVGNHEIVSKLGANLFLQSTLQYDAKELKVILSLNDPASGIVLRHAGVIGSYEEPLSLLTDVTEQTLSMLDIKADSSFHLVPNGLGTKPVAQNFFFRGLGHYAQAQWEEAVEDLRQALSFESNFSEAEASLAQALLQIRDTETASTSQEEIESHARRALELNANSGQAQFAMGEVRLNQGLIPEAATHFERAVQLGPLNRIFLNRLCLTHDKPGQEEDLVRHLEAVVEKQPEFWLGYSFLGLSYFYSERLEDAARTFSRVLDLAPGYLAAVNSLGIIYARMNCLELSLATHLKALDLGEAGGVHTNIAVSLFYLGRHDEALDYAERAIQFLDRDPLEARNYIDFGNLADILYWATGSEHEKAMDAYRKALQRVDDYMVDSPGDTLALESRALFVTMLGNLEEGRREIDRIVEEAEPRASALYKAAIIHQMSNDTERAARCLARSLELGESVFRASNEPIFSNSEVLRAVVARFPIPPCPIKEEP